MRCQGISFTKQLGGKLARLAASEAEARILRNQMLDNNGDLKKKDLIIEPIDVPTMKPELLAFINGLLVQ
jgi:hypothetical protein